MVIFLLKVTVKTPSSVMLAMVAVNESEWVIFLVTSDTLVEFESTEEVLDVALFEEEEEETVVLGVTVRVKE